MVDGVVSIYPEHAIPGSLIDGRELIEAAAAQFEMLDIDLDRLPRDVDLAPPSGPWAIAFQRHPGGTRCRFRIRWMVGGDT